MIYFGRGSWTNMSDFPTKILPRVYVNCVGNEVNLLVREPYHSLVAWFVQKYEWVQSMPFSVNWMPFLDAILTHEISILGISTTFVAVVQFAVRKSVDLTKLVVLGPDDPTFTVPSDESVAFMAANQQ